MSACDTMRISRDCPCCGQDRYMHRLDVEHAAYRFVCEECRTIIEGVESEEVAA